MIILAGMAKVFKLKVTFDSYAVLCMLFYNILQKNIQMSWHKLIKSRSSINKQARVFFINYTCVGQRSHLDINCYAYVATFDDFILHCSSVFY